MPKPPEVQFVTVHGYKRAFVKTGSGPAVLLLHGLGSDATTWEPVIDDLAKRYTVIAPDLLGHGRSDKPRADYSLGGYANGMRELLTILGIDKVTVVGHSFGGGVAMQFAYQFPERTERLVLVATGGLGREVSIAIRAVTMPFFHQTAGVMTLPVVRPLVQGALRSLSKSGIAVTRDFDEIADIIESWRDPAARRAIHHVVSGVVDLNGQIVTMRDRAYLTQAMPMCVVWGAEDHVLPVRHAEVAAEIAPTATVEVIANAGHFPHKDHPQRFVKILDDFIRSTEPAVYRRAKWRALLVHGAQAPVPVVADEELADLA
jgi:pimeloyl-ACP methyl ester carboxylesterase